MINIKQFKQQMPIFLSGILSVLSWHETKAAIRYQNNRTQSGAGMLWYCNEMPYAGMPMPVVAAGGGI
jgi:hypothetical protein